MFIALCAARASPREWHRCPPAVEMKIPPIHSLVFAKLGSPANYTTTLAEAEDDQVSVIKWQAPYCRTCRATSPLLDRAAKQFPTARFYSMDLERNGKAAGERMANFFKEKKVTSMPYVEVYLGSTLVEAEVIPPSRVEQFELAIGAAMEQLRTLSTPRGVSRQLVLLRRALDMLQAKRKVSTKGKPSTTGESAGSAAGIERMLGTTGRLQSKESRRHPFRSPERQARLRRGAPQRGATGGRRKGWR